MKRPNTTRDQITDTVGACVRKLRAELTCRADMATAAPDSGSLPAYRLYIAASDAGTAVYWIQVHRHLPAVSIALGGVSACAPDLYPWLDMLNDLACEAYRFYQQRRADRVPDVEARLLGRAKGLLAAWPG
jgi:hypothetical protein